MTINYFKKPSFEEIETKILKEIGKDDFSFNYQPPFDDISLVPIYTSSKYLDNNCKEYKESYTFQYFIININIDINKNIISALNNGVNALVLDFDNKHFTDTQLDSIFNNIDFSIIKTIFLNTTKNILDLYAKRYTKTKNEFLFDQSNIFTIRNNYFFEDSTHMLKEYEKDKSAIKYVFVETSGEFYTDICKIKALNELNCTISSKLNKYDKIKLIAKPILNFESNNKNEYNILYQTTQILSIMLNSIDGILISSFDNSFDTFSNRISRNIANILKNESYLEKNIDYTRGSYFFENYSKEIALKIYNLL